MKSKSKSKLNLQDVAAQLSSASAGTQEAINIIRSRYGLEPVDSILDAIRGRSAAIARATRRKK